MLQAVGALRRGKKQSAPASRLDRKSTRLNSSHLVISYAVFCLKKKKTTTSTYSTTSSSANTGTICSSDTSCVIPSQLHQSRYHTFIAASGLLLSLSSALSLRC